MQKTINKAIVALMTKATIWENMGLNPHVVYWLYTTVIHDITYDSMV